MPREHFESPVVSELSIEAVNIAFQNLGQTLNQISETLSRLEGLDGNDVKFSGDVDLGGKTLKGVKKLTFNSPTKAVRGFRTPSLIGNATVESLAVNVETLFNVLKERGLI